MNDKLLTPGFVIIGLTVIGTLICYYFDNSKQVVAIVTYSLIPIIAALFVVIINEMREGLKRITYMDDE